MSEDSKITALQEYFDKQKLQKSKMKKTGGLKRGNSLVKFKTIESLGSL